MMTTASPRPGLLALLADRSIYVKILAALTAVIGVMALSTGWWVTKAMHEQETTIKALHRQAAVGLMSLGRVHQEEILARNNLANYASSVSPEAKATWLKKIAATDAEQARWEKQFEEHDPQDVGRSAAWAAFKENWAKFLEVRDQELLPALARGDLAGYEKVRDAKAVPAISAAADALDEVEAEENQEAKDMSDAAAKNAASDLRVALLILGLGMAGALGAGVVVVRAVVRPLREVNDVLAKVADGDLTVRASVHSGDEAGQMATSLNRAVETVEGIVSQIHESSASLAAAAEQMSATSTQMAAGAERQSLTIGSAATSAAQVSQNVQTVAAGSEEMDASIREISASANEAARVGQEAMDKAARTNEIVARLGDSSSEIGSVVRAIEAISAQTNMLALNATIEAARAGESGRGFAVVANEVKDLARESVAATGTIQEKVTAIQSDVAEAIAAIAQIAEVVAQVTDYQTTIASAVEEQSATTNEMNRNVAEAAGGSDAIARDITDVADTASESAESSTQLREVSGQVAQMAAHLRAAVSQFTVTDPVRR